MSKYTWDGSSWPARRCNLLKTDRCRGTIHRQHASTTLPSGGSAHVQATRILSSARFNQISDPAVAVTLPLPPRYQGLAEPPRVDGRGRRSLRRSSAETPPPAVPALASAAGLSGRPPALDSCSPPARRWPGRSLWPQGMLGLRAGIDSESGMSSSFSNRTAGAVGLPQHLPHSPQHSAQEAGV